ncbi:chaperone protein DnaK, putative [Synechococcus sp. PCC 7335]|nr:molecular chaperone DnaK [Synechococcus sp. PCC 7335]EDX85782.1 chaperone protein DnaK, putative [Synechococcus sp. PCC 7335]
MGKVVGIDLGTTNSVVAVMEGGKPVVIANVEGMRTTPSVVAFSKEGEKLIGQMARRQAVLNPQNTFYAVKRFVGRKYDELSSEAKRLPYAVRRGESGNVKLRCDRLDRDFAPEEISAMILRKLAEEASQYLGQSVTGAVITVPAYFNDAQRQATRDAGRIAGLEVKRIINEPTAASLAYGLDQQYNQTILVFDLGGGTFDVSILDVGDGVFEVRSTSGDTQLGGLNFDKVIVDWLAEAFLEKEGVDLRRDRQSLQRLNEAAEKAKIELSGVPVTAINLPFITATKDGPKHIETRLERSHFESLCSDLISRMRGPLKQALADATVTPTQVDEVVLVGGASRMPMVQDLVRSVMNREPNRNVNPDEVVAIGAAIQAGILTQEVKDILLLDVTPLSLGLETIGGVTKKLIPRNTTIPVRRSDTFSTSENNQTVVEVHILQGEREMVDDNKSLGRFKLMGIPPAPRGIPQVQVSFDIDANGILQVSALDKTTGRQQSITVQEASNLSEAEIQDMIRAAEQNAATDRLQRDRIEKRNRAEALTFKAERVLREVAIDFGMQFGRDRRRRIENLVQQLRAALEQSDDRGIDMFQADLQNEVYELNREAYLYDLEEDGEGILGAIGNTLKQAFSGEDDDYYRTGDYGYGAGSGYETGYSAGGYAANPYGQQAQWDTPSWSQGSGRGNSWDDWDDDWESTRRPQSPPATRYSDSRGGYQSDSYNSGGYNSGGYKDNYNPDNYKPDGYSSDSYKPDSYTQEPRYSQDPYAKGDRPLEPRDQRNGYSQDNYSRENGYGQSSSGNQDAYGGRPSQYSQDSYSQERYNQPASQDVYEQKGSWQEGYQQSEYRQGDSQQGDYQPGSSVGPYDQGGYSQDDYGQQNYGQQNYGQQNYGQQDYRPRRQQSDYDEQDYARSRQRSPQDNRRQERETEDDWF